MNQPHDKQKFRLLILLIILLLVASAAFILYRFTTQNNSSPTTQKTDASTWKTYKNKDYGFEFDYPSTFGEPKIDTGQCDQYKKDIEIDKDEPKPIDCTRSILIEFTKSDKSSAFLQVIQFVNLEGVYRIYYEGTGSDLNLAKDKRNIEEASSEVKNDQKISDQAASMVGNEQKYMVKELAGLKALNYYDIFTPGGSINDNYRFYKNNQLFEFSSNYTNYPFGSEDQKAVKEYDINKFSKETKEQFEEFDKIMSTFEFVSNDSASDWKTYENKEQGYLIDYPGDWTYKKENNRTKFNAVADIEKIGQGYQEGAWLVWVEVYQDSDNFLTTLYDYSNETNLEEYLKAQLAKKSPFVISYKVITIENNKAFKVIGGGMTPENETIYIEKDNQMFVLSDIATNTTFDKMAETFEFKK